MYFFRVTTSPICVDAGRARWRTTAVGPRRYRGPHASAFQDHRQAAPGVPLHRVRQPAAQVGRPLPGVQRLGDGRGVRRRADPDDGRRPGQRARPPDRPGGRPGRDGPLDGRAGAGSSARRRAGPRCGGAAGRRARRRQVHPAAGRRGQGGHRAAPHALRHRRGVGRPGPAARRPDQRAVRAPLPRRRVRPRRRARAHRGGQPRPADPGLGTDHRLRRAGRRPRRPGPGPRGGGRADPGVQGARHGHPAGRPRHQGRPDRWPAPAGAPGGRGAQLRGGPARPAAPHPRGQEPLRRHRRGGLLRAARRGHRRPGRPVRPLPDQA